MNRLLGILVFSGLVTVTIALLNFGQAQQEPQSEANPFAVWDQQQAETPAPQSTSDPFANTTQAGFEAADSPASQVISPMQMRVNDLLNQSLMASKQGQLDQALELATQADAMARQHNIQFTGGQLTPSKLVAQLELMKPEAAGGTQDPKRFAGSQLKAARLQIQNGNYDKAMELAQSVSQLNLTYGPFDDRPDLVIRDLTRLAKANGYQMPVIQQVAAQQPQPQQAQQPVQPSTVEMTKPMSNREQAQYLLVQAKAAMEAGDYTTARTLTMQAQRMDVQYNLFDERPEQVIALIERASGGRLIAAGQPTQQPAQAPVDPQRTNALEMLTAARNALRAGDLQAARQMATQARQMNAGFDVFDDRPELVLADVSAAEARESLAQLAPATPAQPQARAMQPQAAPAQPQAMPQAVSQLAPVQQAQAPVPPQEKPVAKPANAQELLAQARGLIQQGQLQQARELALQAMNLGGNFTPFDDRPDLVLAEIARLQPSAKPIESQVVAQAQPQSQQQVTQTAMTDSAVMPADQKMRAQSGREAFTIGLQALRAGDRTKALEAFRLAKQIGNDLNAQQHQQIQDFLQELTPGKQTIQLASGENANGNPFVDPNQPAPIDSVIQQQTLVFDKLRSETLNAMFRAERLRENNSDDALTILDEAVNAVKSAQLSDEQSAMLLGSLERSRTSIELYREQREPIIALQRRNREVRDQIEQERSTQIRIQQELGDLVSEFNRLMDDRRYREAEVVAKQALELDPDNPTTHLMKWKARFAFRNARNDKLKDDKEVNFVETLDQVEQSILNEVVKDPIAFPENFAELTARRSRFRANDSKIRTELEMHIEQSLVQPISLHFDQKPLSDVLRHIAEVNDINIWTDTVAFQEDVQISSDTPVSIHVDGVQLKSALNLILGPFGLGYSIENEVLKISSKIRLQGELVPLVYDVADLCVPLDPLPVNLNGSRQLGGGGQYSVAPSVAGPFGNALPQIGDPLASNDFDQFDNMFDPASERVRKQRADFESLSSLITDVISPDSWTSVGGNGEVRAHDSTLSLVIRQTQSVHQEISDLLDQLRRLQDLQVTIEVRFITVSDRFFERIGIDFDFNVQDNAGDTTTTNDGTPLAPFGRVDGSRGTTTGGVAGAGGQGAQGVRDLSDDNPFDLSPLVNLINRDSYDKSGTIVGLTNGNEFTDNLDIPFRQGSFAVGVPDFGNFNPEVGLSVGFAVLSDIEAFFFIQAAQSDERSNIMLAPKITLQNGRPGIFADVVQRPFVTSLTPVVSTFNVGFTPQITTLSEGVTFTVQAVISADRRYVRLSVAPNFTTITDVFTFSFVSGGTGGNQQGGIGGNQGGIGGGGIGGGGGNFGGGGVGQGFGGIGGNAGQGAAGGVGGGNNGNNGNNQGGNTGGTSTNVTVQQPVQELLTVQTVVTVPDGGTVLLGGIKRLREGRNMAGVPILNKMPYISRLFKNTGVGRETESLMLMVTPRIMINEEEEALLGIELE